MLLWYTDAADAIKRSTRQQLSDLQLKAYELHMQNESRLHIEIDSFQMASIDAADLDPSCSSPTEEARNENVAKASLSPSGSTQEDLYDFPASPALKQLNTNTCFHHDVLSRNSSQVCLEATCVVVDHQMLRLCHLTFSVSRQA